LPVSASTKAINFDASEDVEGGLRRATTSTEVILGDESRLERI
jgi:hypothetical protein